MGVQGFSWPNLRFSFAACASLDRPQAMVAMKAMKVGQTALSKGGIADALSAKTGLKKKECYNALNTLAEVGVSQVKANGKFNVPGLCFIKTRLKPATQAGKKEMFGQTVMVKAMKARTVVKARPASALKQVV